ncbi:unnamed protein product [Prorocentrum cordatum]|uniref:Uncharacterized protein n=1 Tax=Prorocentrum cordatum TaxID=2364126 RepID=A0ABN9W1B6_9DINO|nr:unnamed protein product [Polarella glacialis]
MRPEERHGQKQGRGLRAVAKRKLRYESYAEQAAKTKADKLERKQRRYEIMQELMQCSTQVKHLVSPMFRYKLTQQGSPDLRRRDHLAAIAVDLAP